MLPQKEETFQVIIDVIKNSTCYKAFTISVKVPEIFLQQFWYTIKKVTDTNSYEFHLANKKCLVDAEVFQKILDICPRVQGEDFTKVPNDESTLTFLIDPGSKYLHTHTIKDDGVVSRPKFVRIGKDFKKYGLPIPETMLTEGIKQSDVYKILHWLNSSQKEQRKQTASRRVIKKKVFISPDDNINPELDIALEVGKSMSLTEAIEEEAARQVHATHERIMSESDPKPARRRPSGIAFKDTSTLKASRKSNKSLPLVGGSSEGTGVSPGVPNESTIILKTSSEGIDAEVAESEKGDVEIIDTAKADAEKTEEAKDDIKKAKFPPSSSSLSVSSSYGNQSLNLSSDKSTVGNLKDSADAEINSLLDV
ncbi:hypothetical protein Tco_1258452 [Tanacetum coccineum]